MEEFETLSEQLARGFAAAGAQGNSGTGAAKTDETAQ